MKRFISVSLIIGIVGFGGSCKSTSEKVTMALNNHDVSELERIVKDDNEEKNNDLLLQASGNIKALEVMVANGYDINHLDEKGRGLLDQAMYREDLLDFILKHKDKVNFNVRDKYDSSPYSSSFRLKNKELIDLFLDAGVDINTESSENKNILYEFTKCEKGDLELMQYLVRRGANWKHQDDKGSGLGVLYARDYDSKDYSCFEYLLKKGVDPNERWQEDFYAIHFAIRDNNFETLKFLIKNKANVNAKNQSGYTPLHWSVMFKGYRTVELLLKSGAKPNVRNIDGETPLYLATKNNSFPIMQLLRKYGAKM